MQVLCYIADTRAGITAAIH